MLNVIMYAAPFEWNLLQTKLKLQTLLPLQHFKSIIRSLEVDSQLICNCFKCFNCLFVVSICKLWM